MGKNKSVDELKKIFNKGIDKVSKKKYERFYKELFELRKKLDYHDSIQKNFRQGEEESKITDPKERVKFVFNDILENYLPISDKYELTPEEKEKVEALVSILEEYGIRAAFKAFLNFFKKKEKK